MPLARQVRTTELGNRIVSVLVEDPFVELVGTLYPDRRTLRHLPHLVEKFVQKESTQRLGGTWSSAQTGHPSRPPAGSAAQTPARRGW